MSLGNLFTYSYWFTQPALAQKDVYWVWVGILLLILTIGFAALVARLFLRETTYVPVFEKVGGLGITMGLIGIVLFFFRQENVYLFGWRIWFLVWGLVFIFWLYRILWYVFKRLPQIRAEKAERARREKYLP